MAIFLDEITCPHCQHPQCIEDTNVQEQTITVHCPACGYHSEREAAQIDPEEGKTHPFKPEYVNYAAYRMKMKALNYHTDGFCRTAADYVLLKADVSAHRDLIEMCVLSRATKGEDGTFTFESIDLLAAV